MIIFWILKFSLNEDLCLVDYQPFESDDEDISLPDVSFCIGDPFINEKLYDFDTNSMSYLNHLEGNAFNESLLNISYEDVTIDLNTFLSSAYVTYSNGSLYTVDTIHIQSHFSGFWYSLFFKCFLVELNLPKRQNVKYVSLYFNRDLHQYWMKNNYSNVMAKPNHRHQLFLSETWKYLNGDRKEPYGFTAGFIMTKIEILRKRNKGQNYCMENFTNWDKSVYDDKV